MHHLSKLYTETIMSGIYRTTIDEIVMKKLVVEDREREARNMIF